MICSAVPNTRKIWANQLRHYSPKALKQASACKLCAQRFTLNKKLFVSVNNCEKSIKFLLQFPNLSHMRYLISILLIICPLLNLWPQENQSLFKRLNASDGMSNNWVRCIYMDDIGYMWFGTADGLNKYDGHGFTIYRPKTISGKSIGNINVSGVLNKSRHELWVCTDLGVF